MKKTLITAIFLIIQNSFGMTCTGMIVDYKINKSGDIKQVKLEGVEKVGWHTTKIDNIRFTIATFSDNSFRTGFGIENSNNTSMTSMIDQKGQDFEQQLMFSEGPVLVKNIILECSKK